MFPFQLQLKTATLDKVVRKDCLSINKQANFDDHLDEYYLLP